MNFESFPSQIPPTGLPHHDQELQVSRITGPGREVGPSAALNVYSMPNLRLIQSNRSEKLFAFDDVDLDPC